MEEKNREVKGIWIPIDIWKDKNLSWNEKILLLEVDSYTSKDKDCYISDEYISDFLGVNKTNANKTLSSLIKKGYVKKTRFDGRRRFVKAALSQSTTLPCQEQQLPRACDNNYYNSTSNNLPNKEEDTNVSPKKDLFEECWKTYGRKGSKKNALEQWNKLKQEDYDKIKEHIPFYVKSNDFVYLKDFERYLRHRMFESKVVDKKGQILYDPERDKSNVYHPTCDCSLMWNDQFNTYIYIGFWDGEHIYDGYTEDNRPDGATVMLNNGRGNIVWDKQSKMWRKM